MTIVKCNYFCLCLEIETLYNKKKYFLNKLYNINVILLFFFLAIFAKSNKLILTYL